VPTNAAIELRLDRYVRPSDGLRQAIVVYTGDRAQNLFTAFEPEYDMLERVITFKLRTGALFSPRTLYTIEVVQPALNADQGLHAFDGAPLEPAAAPLRISFTTWSAPPVAPAPPPSTPVDCSELLDPSAGQAAIFTVCAQCHAPPNPPMGLDLSSPAGLIHTAIGHVAHQTETGDSGGRTLRAPARFGVEMPIIDPGFAANSYALYKLLRNMDNFVDADGQPCTTEHRVPAPAGDCLEFARQESTRLREWFVRGDPMPPAGHVNRQAVARLARWIAAGAPCR
jgi:hypothetical protein